MKQKDFKRKIIMAAIVGVIAIGVGIGLIFWYKSKSNSTIVSFVFSGLILTCGVGCVVASLINLIQFLMLKEVLEKGQVAQARYIRHDCNVYNKNGSLYFIEYEFENDGQKITKKSGNEFSWNEILALKCAKEFQIKYYKNRCAMAANLAALQNKYMKEMIALQDVYNKAYNGVDDMIKRDEEIAHKRIKHKSKKEACADQQKVAVINDIVDENEINASEKVQNDHDDKQK